MHKFVIKLRKVCAQAAELFTGPFASSVACVNSLGLSAAFTSLIPNFSSAVFVLNSLFNPTFTHNPHALLLKKQLNKYIGV